MQEIVVRGIIGKSDHQKPTLRRSQKVVDSKVIINEFMHFQVIVSDTSQKKTEAGFYPNVYYQVTLTPDEFGKRVFSHLTAGRSIEVKGFLTEEKNGEYLNKMIKNARVTFLDMPIEKYGPMVFDKITDDQMQGILAASQNPQEVKSMLLAAFLKTAKEQFEAGRVIIDNTEEKLEIKNPLTE